MSNDFINKFYKSAKIFLTATFKDIKQRLRWTFTSFSLVEAFLLERKDCFDNLKTLAARFSNVIAENEIIQFSNEVGLLNLDARSIARRIDVVSSFLEVWEKEKANYTLIFKLAKALQVLPYSTAGVERVFSALTDIKTIKRNRLDITNLQSCLLVKQHFRNKEVSISEDIISRYNSSNEIIEPN